jgi:hypothetical protein
VVASRPDCQFVPPSANVTAPLAVTVSIITPDSRTAPDELRSRDVADALR